MHLARPQRRPEARPTNSKSAATQARPTCEFRHVWGCIGYSAKAFGCLFSTSWNDDHGFDSSLGLQIRYDPCILTLKTLYGDKNCFYTCHDDSDGGGDCCGDSNGMLSILLMMRHCHNFLFCYLDVLDGMCQFMTQQTVEKRTSWKLMLPSNVFNAIDFLKYVKVFFACFHS